MLCCAHPVEETKKNRLLRQLPSVEQILSSDTARELGIRHGRTALRRAARRAVDAARDRLLADAGQAPGSDLPLPEGPAEPALEAEVEQRLRRELAAQALPGLRRVINATGVVLHTGLGRAPLAEAAQQRLLDVAAGYSNLELDLETGERGTRHAHLAALVTELTGAEAALVVNNCAGALLLALSALAGDRAAVISRGELVEIGGGFRLPEVMALGRVRLLEVGTTNRTRLADYERALVADASLVVKVHRSNFTVSGFTEEVSVRELSTLARRHAIPLFYDLGSGLIAADRLPRATSEPSVASALRDGADLVAFSGDKLLGGPQAGILAGSRKLIRALQKHPLQRALRIDKLTAAALEATLMLHRDGHEERIPALRMLRAGGAEVRARAERLRVLLGTGGVPEGALSIRAVAGKVGGGSLPDHELPSFALALAPGSAEGLAQALRRGDPAVVARVSEGVLLLDARTVDDAEVETLAAAVARAWGAVGRPGLQGIAHA